MINGKKVLAIIPARGGSKGLPGKNIKLLHGKHLLSYTLDTAKLSRYIDCIVLSTDSPEIARVAITNGLEVPFLRPAHLATDSAATIDVIEHVIKMVEEQYDYLVILQPTSPLRNVQDIDSCVELLASKEANAVLSVVELEHPLEWANILPEDGRMDDFIHPDIRFTPRQHLPKRYRLNGAVYAVRTAYLLTHRNYFHHNCFAYVMPKERSVDIDNQLDFDFADFIIQKRSI